MSFVRAIQEPLSIRQALGWLCRWNIHVLLTVIILQPVLILLFDPDQRRDAISFNGGEDTSRLTGDLVIMMLPMFLGAACAFWSGWLLSRGRTRPQLHLAVAAFWLALPGQFCLAFALHCWRLWQAGIGIYDQGAWLSQISGYLFLAIFSTIYLLASPHIRARFSRPMENVAEIF